MKNPLFSKTIQGILLLVLPHFLAKLGLKFDDAQAQALTEDILTALGGLWAAYGRFNAETPLKIPFTGTNLPTRIFAFCLLPFAFGLVGCASFSTRIEEANADGSTRVTVINSRTLFDSKSELAKLRTSHTDKTQSVSLGSITQESSGSNAVSLVEAAVGAAVKAAVGK